jgi:hypothetical protein
MVTLGIKLLRDLQHMLRAILHAETATFTSLF